MNDAGGYNGLRYGLDQIPEDIRTSLKTITEVIQESNPEFSMDTFIASLNNRVKDLARTMVGQSYDQQIAVVKNFLRDLATKSGITELQAIGIYNLVIDFLSPSAPKLNSK